MKHKYLSLGLLESQISEQIILLWSGKKSKVDDRDRLIWTVGAIDITWQKKYDLQGCFDEQRYEWETPINQSFRVWRFLILW